MFRNLMGLIRLCVFPALLLLAMGCGKDSPTFSLLPAGQIFKQNAGVFNNQLDILFVIDNSGSMADEQTNLANNFSSFISNFRTKGYDFKIAVIGTDAYLANPLLSGYNPANSTAARFRDRAVYTSEGVFGAITNDADCGNPVAPSTGITTILPSTPNLSSVFSTNVRQCIRGTGDERAFSSFMTALTHSSNAGFLRPQSFLAIIVVSDGDDFSSYSRPVQIGNWGNATDHNYAFAGLDSVSSYVSQLDTLTRSSPAFRRYNVSNISRLSSACGNGDPGPLVFPTRYMQLTAQTDGVSGSICDTSFANSLEAIQSKIAELSTQFFLDRVPAIDSIVVVVDGVNVPQNTSNGWTYNPSANSIVFHGSAIPSQNATISVAFVPTTIIR